MSSLEERGLRALAGVRGSTRILGDTPPSTDGASIPALLAGIALPFGVIAIGLTIGVTGALALTEVSR